MGWLALLETSPYMRQESVLSPVMFNIIMNNVCNKKSKVTDLKAFIYEMTS
jgi:hypothetical protein